MFKVIEASANKLKHCFLVVCIFLLDVMLTGFDTVDRTFDRFVFVPAGYRTLALKQCCTATTDIKFRCNEK